MDLLQICSVATFVGILKAVPHRLDNLPRVTVQPNPFFVKYNVLSNVGLLIVYDTKYLICEEFSISTHYPDHKVFFFNCKKMAPFPLTILKTFEEYRLFG